MRKMGEKGKRRRAGGAGREEEHWAVAVRGRDRKRDSV